MEKKIIEKKKKKELKKYNKNAYVFHSDSDGRENVNHKGGNRKKTITHYKDLWYLTLQPPTMHDHRNMVEVKLLPFAHFANRRRREVNANMNSDRIKPEGFLQSLFLKYWWFVLFDGGQETYGTRTTTRIRSINAKTE